METHDENFLKKSISEFNRINENWNNKHADAISIYLELKDLSKEVFYFIYSNNDSIVKPKLLALHTKITNLMVEVKEHKRIIYIMRTRKDKVIAVANKRLLEKCIESLGKDNVKFTQMYICETEDDLNNAFAEETIKGQVLHLCTDKDCQL